MQATGLRTISPYVRQIERVSRNLVTFTRRDPLGAFSGLVLLAIVIVALAAPLIAPYDPLEAQNNYRDVRVAPSGTYWLGTDEISRDFLSRIIHGTRISLFVAFMAVLVGDGVGLIWGTASGYLGGKFDIIGQRFLDLIMSFPTLILAMVLLLALGGGVHTVIIAIAITRVPTSTRVIRSVVLSVKENVYVDAARAIGASDLRVMTLHIVPQCIAPFLILATAHLGTVIITEASLGFLGMGIPPPAPSWGNMLGGSVGEFKPSWWLVLFPGVAITITVLAFNLFGDTIRDVLDPKLRGR